MFHRTQIGVCRQQKGKTPSSYPPHGKITSHRHRTEKLHRQQHKLYGILTLSSVSMPHFRNPCGQESLMTSRLSSDDSEEDRYKPQPYPLAIDVLKNTINPIWNLDFSSLSSIPTHTHPINLYVTRLMSPPPSYGLKPCPAQCYPHIHIPSRLVYWRPRNHIKPWFLAQFRLTPTSTSVIYMLTNSCRLPKSYWIIAVPTRRAPADGGNWT